MGLISSKITLTKEKERWKRKIEEEERRRREKSSCCTLSFYNGYFGDFGQKKLSAANGPFSGNVIKNPARYTQTEQIDHPPRSTPPTLHEQILA